MLTIVAASGNDANSGLPGVFTMDRKPFQHVEIVQGLNLANAMPEIWDVFSTSPWSTRAWTYQERKLSNRLLIFTSNLVYFNCAHTSYQEDRCLETEQLHPELSRFHQNERDHRLITRKRTNFETYVKELREYSTRNLSYDSDALKAFTGIIQLLSISLRAGFRQGIPETAFEAGLLWYPNGDLMRRKDPETREGIFPSWSWAGWKGSVTYDDDNLVLTTLSRTKWLDEDSGIAKQRCFISEEEASKHQDWPGWKRWERRCDFMDHLVTYIYFIEEDEPDVWFSHPILPPDEEKGSLCSMDSEILHFKALTASFTITGEHSKSSFFNTGSLSATDPTKHNVCHFLIFDSKGHHAGTIHVPHNIGKTLIRGVHEFVALSRTTISSGDDDTSFHGGTFKPPDSSDDKDDVNWDEGWENPSSGRVGMN